MDFRYLEAFYHVAHEISFVRAAEQLCISPSAVTRQIKLLEEDLKKNLLIRSTKSVSLTKDGQNLYNAINRFYGNLKESGLTDHEVTLKIGTMEGVLKEKLMPLIKNLEKNQIYNLYIEVNSPHYLFEQLSKGELDLIFISNVNETNVPNSFEKIPYCEEKIVLISKRKISLNKIHDHTWICFEPNTWITRYSKRKPQKVIRVNHMDSLIDLVKEGSGVAMIPQHCLGDKKGLWIQEVKKFATQDISIITGPLYSRPDYVKKFLDLL